MGKYSYTAAVLPTASVAYVKSEGEVLSAEIAAQPKISADY
jgi:hypothetical protein